MLPSSARMAQCPTFTWNNIGRMMITFEGFTLNANAIMEDTVDVVGGLSDDRLGSQASSQSAPAAPAPVIRPGSSRAPSRVSCRRGLPASLLARRAVSEGWRRILASRPLSRT